MKKYVSHKIVKAAKITGVNPADKEGKIYLHLEDDNERAIKPSGTNYHPSIGDYLVEYEDGYRSLSPKAAFESGYKEMNDE